MDHPRSLSAKFKEDFAYPTIKDRIPVILTKVIDFLYRSKDSIHLLYAQEGSEELKAVIGSMSKLKNEIQTNKNLLPLDDGKSDVTLWNNYLESDRKYLGEDPKWFVSAWLYTECYFYRRLMQCFYRSKFLKDIDPFKDQKCNALTASMPAVISLAHFLKEAVEKSKDSCEMRSQFLKDFIQICLWGNKCDLSISAGVENAQKISIEKNLHTLLPHILCDDQKCIEERLLSSGEKSCIHIVLDNAGFELISDLVLIEYLLQCKLVSSIVLHGKAMPWFVSDTTIEDFQWTLAQLQASSDETLQMYGDKWKQYLDTGVFKFRSSIYWTLPHDYAQMKSIDPGLYKELAEADLIIFKGDLNYRKLTGDLKWNHDTKFKDALRGFCPAALCTLRTLKCDLVVGITKEIATKTEENDNDWLLNANWGVIQYAE